MKIYLVGGAVRDQLLGHKVTERDWVVVGATVEEMLAQKFKPVGKDFPVFIHPETGEEYALARTERKIARGYKGFEFHTALDVTLEEDLLRRDLTINAMAEDLDGKIIDPYGGQKDLQDKILRHVSAAFAEDPVRILRVARFSARFPEFQVAKETNAVMKQMVVNGEVNALVAERIWKELERAMQEKSPERFFQTLEDCGALPSIFPDLVKHLNAETVNYLKVATNLTSNPVIRFTAFMYGFDLIGSEVKKFQKIKKFCEQYKLPNPYQSLMIITHQYFNSFQIVSGLSAEKLLDFLQGADAFRQKQRFVDFLRVCLAIEGGSSESKDKIQYLEKIVELLLKIDVEPFIKQGLSGTAIASAINRSRISRIEEYLKAQI